VKPQQVAFLGLPDGSVPSADALDGARAVEMTLAVLSEWPDVRTVLLPWRRDPHPDHRATWSLFTAALDGTQKIVRRLEYPIWAMVHPAPDDLPRTGEARLWRLDIGAVGHQKRAAILAHRSQTTAMIDDAAIGHCLPESVLAQFSHPWELFIEVGS
jgi:LmbE family N-acetylglucosaminyl deacetylase